MKKRGRKKWAWLLALVVIILVGVGLNYAANGGPTSKQTITASMR